MQVVAEHHGAEGQRDRRIDAAKGGLCAIRTRKRLKRKRPGPQHTASLRESGRHVRPVGAAPEARGKRIGRRAVASHDTLEDGHSHGGTVGVAACRCEVEAERFGPQAGTGPVRQHALSQHMYVRRAPGTFGGVLVQAAHRCQSEGGGRRWREHS